MKQFWKIALAGTLFAAPLAANAVVIEFDLTFDGTNISVDGGSNVPAGTSFVAGDGFDLDLRAAGNDFWRVDSAYNQGLPLTFFVLDGGTRNANINTTFYLDGASVFNIVNNNVSQSSVHIGAQSWSLAAGLEFDMVSMTYDLLSSTAPTTIQDVPDIFESFALGDSPFFRSDLISYNAAVPEPSIIALFAAGLFGLGFARRRKV